MMHHVLIPSLQKTSAFLTKVLTLPLLLGVLLSTAEDVVATDLKFEPLDTQQTGLRSLMERWREEEAERQKSETGTHGWWPWGLRAFDYDLDGDLDLIASHHGRPTSIILRNQQKETGRLTFTNATAELGLKPRELPGADDRPWIWDFDGDGYLDIAGLSDESRPSSAWNLGGKRFQTTGRPLFSPLSHPREVIDLNGDGYLDVDGGNRGQWFYVPKERTFRHDKKPRFEIPKDIPAAVLKRVELYESQAGRFAHVLYQTHEILGYDTLGYAPRPIDLNDDGRPDLVVHGSGGYGAAYLGRYLIRQPDGTLVDQTESLGLPEEGAPILTADLSGDAQAEILICGKKQGGLYIADKSGRYARKPGALSDLLTRRDPYLIRAFRADFDNDGDIDLVISQPRLGRETVFENRGEGVFLEVLKLAGWDSNPVVIADLDEDGRLDLIVGVKTKNKVGDIAVYLNRTAQTGRFAKIEARMPSPNPYAVGSVIEVYAPGALAEKSAQPIVCEKAHADGTPVHVGLGTWEQFDLRVTFPDGKQQVARKLEAGSRIVADSEKQQVILSPFEKSD